MEEHGVPVIHGCTVWSLHRFYNLDLQWLSLAIEPTLMCSLWWMSWMLLLHRGEELTVSAALNQHLDYRDTSRWAGGRKPKNWAQSAKRVQWWDQMLSERGDPLAISYHRENTLDQSVDRMIEQYGRKFALWILHRAGEDGHAVTDLLIHTFARCVARTREEDVAALLEEMQPKDRQRVQRWLRKLQSEASVVAERMEPPQGGESDPSL